MDSKILVALCILIFGFHTSLGDISDDELRIHENFQNLFQGISRNDNTKTKEYEDVLKTDRRRQDKAFNAMKEEIGLARRRKSAHRRIEKSDESPRTKRNHNSQNEDAERHTKNEISTTRSSAGSTSSPSPSFQQGATSKWKDILQAAAHNDTAAVKDFIYESEPLVRMTTKDEKTIVHIAVENGYLPLLQYLFENNHTSPIFYPDNAGNTALQRAIERGDFPIVKYLVDVCEWNVSKPNPMFYGDTPIHVAAATGRLEILKYFIENKQGDPNVRNGLGDPPAFHAAQKSQLSVIKYLHEEAKADMTSVNGKQCNILHYSARSGDLTVPKYLLDEKRLPFDVDWRDITNCTILYTAAKYAKFDFIQYLVRQHHADVNIADEMGRTPLHLAAHQNNYPMCSFLVNNGADIEARDAYHNTPLEEATQPQLIGFLDRFPKTRVSQQMGRVRRSVALAPSS